jgi:hypothetical protein
MKGYELYSWSEGGQWHFTLITGTNRNKTAAEIMAPGNYISEAGWVKVTTVGVEETGLVLSKLPQKESVFWLGEPRDQTGPADLKIQLPPQDIISDIEKYAGQYGLDFHTQ